MPASSQPASSDPPAVSLPGMFSGYADAANAALGKMTLREKVGQVFLFECPPSGAVADIDSYQPSGYCLSGSDFQGKTAQQVRKLLQSYQNSSKIPMLLTCDEEGGTVVRVSGNPNLSAKKFQSPQQVFRAGGMSGIRSDTVRKADLLKSLGLNGNLAPVCDISTDPKNFIYDRSFGKSAALTSQFVSASVEAYRAEGIFCVLKHFPGYGDNADTHTGAAHDTRSYQTFVRSDFLPFEAGIQAGAPCVMVSHNIVECMDSTRPASLSPQVHDILRNTLGFSGVIMTDDLSMQAIPAYTGGKSPAVEALLAGNDLLLTSDIAPSFNALYAAVKNGTVSEKRLNQSVLRILAWKCEEGILT